MSKDKITVGGQEAAYAWSAGSSSNRQDPLLNFVRFEAEGATRTMWFWLDGGTKIMPFQGNKALPIFMV